MKSRIRHPIRICFVIDNLSEAGTELQLLALISSLDRSKFEPHLCLLDGTGARSRSLEPRSCSLLRLGVRALRHPSTASKALRFGSFLCRKRIDIVQVHFPDSTYFAVPIARLAGVRRIVGTRRNLGYWTTQRDRWLARIYSRFIDVTVANCEACRDAVIAQEGVGTDSVVVLENGIDVERFAGVPSVLATCNGRVRRIGMVANLRPVKAPDVFVRAAQILASSHPAAEFQIAGTGDEESVLRLAGHFGIQDRFRLEGYVNDVPAFLGGLHVAVLCSHSEGLSNALLEYMAAGRPIVATAVGGNVELIEDGVHGLLVPPDDPQATAEAIHRLLCDPALAARLGAAAKCRVAQLNSREAMVRQYEAFYVDLVRGRH